MVQFAHANHNHLRDPTYMGRSEGGGGCVRYKTIIMWVI